MGGTRSRATPAVRRVHLCRRRCLQRRSRSWRVALYDFCEGRVRNYDVADLFKVYEYGLRRGGRLARVPVTISVNASLTFWAARAEVSMKYSPFSSGSARQQVGRKAMNHKRTNWRTRQLPQSTPYDRAASRSCFLQAIAAHLSPAYKQPP